MNNKLNDLIVISQKDIVGSINLLYDVKNYFSPNVQYIIVVLGYENENLIKLVSNIARVYYNKNMLDNICIIDIMCDSNNYIFNCYTDIPEINNTDVKYIRHSERKSINGKSIIYAYIFLVTVILIIEYSFHIQNLLLNLCLSKI